jgi:hypothetical protein
LPTYEEIITEQRQHLNPQIGWWPIYFYHFTDIHNAIGIIDSGLIYGRNKALEEHLMQSDNASQSVINVTSESVKDCARLYFRPLTPTQYHNEGYKPPHIRKSDINANCPMPVFFFLDAAKTLRTDGVQFAEKGCAGHYGTDLESGEEEFAKLNFAKIFHNGSHESGSDITQYRQSEVIRNGGLPIDSLVRGIVCRSIAEKQTLLYILAKNYPDKYRKYNKYITYKPELKVFYNNGIFIKNVRYHEAKLHVELNEPRLRYGTERSNHQDYVMTCKVEWLDKTRTTLGRGESKTVMDYSKFNVFMLGFDHKLSDTILLEIDFDGNLMYKNIIQLAESNLL